MSVPNHDRSTTTFEQDAMTQHNELIEAADNWSGVSSSKERRRIQNRINQRARRRRKLTELCSDLRASGNNNEEDGGTSSAIEDAGAGYILLPCARKRAQMIKFAREAQINFSLGTPQPTQLEALVGLNLLNALARNARILGFIPQSLCEDHFISPFNLEGPRLPCGPRQASSWPPYLRPTEVQYKITHHPFLDLFPIPSLRETAIRAEDLGFFDEDEFCNDIFGHDHENDEGNGERPRLIVWGESWDPRGWEANAAFIKKWAWLIRGCPELLEGTNRWRQKRGEKRITLGRGQK
nr:uncharacterized protein CTRU02_13130 [Colletotrichum truncatum]XP_036580923.1 uncharacterized protein CTRU02_08888 [Colletotrichum truncatum]KAF6783622.1 hypothetical protein CTRU02_13130 [Colletotrichum truncatum]KAF6789096.1 hypothetical protein CTRU02_08888 [Colletotrichum truncatum]